MKNPYKVGVFAVAIGTVVTGPSQALFAANHIDELPSISKKKIDPSRCYWLEGKMTAEGLCGEKLRPDIPRIMEEAKGGNGLAAYRLGQLFMNGTWGVEKDEEKGIEWYRLAGKHGFHQAQVKLGYMYESGRSGANEDLKEALYWFEASTEGGIYPEMEEKVEALRKRLKAQTSE